MQRLCATIVEQVFKQNVAKHKKKCSIGTLYCSQCPNFSTKSQNDLNYHITKKHGAPKLKIAHICMICKDKFTGFYALRQHKSQVHGQTFETKGESSSLLSNIDDDNLKEELRACQHFLVDLHLAKGRQRVFNFALDSFCAEKINSKLDYVFQQLKCAAKVNLAFGFVLKNIEDASCRYFYTYENNTLLEKSKLLSTGDDLEHNKTLLAGKDLTETCTRERVNTKWKFLKLTNVTIFAALLKDIPMGCKDAVLPEPLLKNRTVNCLTLEQNTRQPYNDNLCLFRALCLHLHGNERLEEETNKLFNLYLQKKDGIEPASFQGVCMDDIPTVEEISGLNIFLYDVDIVEGSLVGELARRSVQKHPSTVRLLRYNSHICYVANIHALFNVFRCPTCDCYFNRPGNLERHLATCQERVKQVYPKSVYQLKETLFDKLDSFNIPYTDEQQLFRNVAIFDFESICVREDGFKDTETTRWIGKHVSISVSISSNLLQENIFFSTPTLVI